MTALSIRPATEDELRLVRSSWRHQMRPRFRDAEPMGPQMHGHPWGRKRYIGQSTAAEMLRLYIDAHATTGDVLVAAVDDDEGSEAVAWASRSLTKDSSGALLSCIVHYVYVLDRARRQGLGARLLRYIRQEARTAGVDAVPGAMNSPGVCLWESERSQ